MEAKVILDNLATKDPEGNNLVVDILANSELLGMISLQPIRETWVYLHNKERRDIVMLLTSSGRGNIETHSNSSNMLQSGFSNQRQALEIRMGFLLINHNARVNLFPNHIHRTEVVPRVDQTL